jgi:hypothetical protein
MKRDIEPLYRKVNTKARGVFHEFGSDAKYDRHTKKGMKKNMKKDVHRGLDYTPLFRFLLSKVGSNWDDVLPIAQSRLDHDEPIYWMVAVRESDKKRYFLAGESSYYSGLFVDENNILQLVDPNLHNEDLSPSCSCCTHTFNGKPFVKKYNPMRRSGY